MPADRPAGRATDAEVAEKVMGLQEADPGAAQLPLSYFCRFSDGSVIIRQDGGSSTFFKPSTSWKSMRLVVERMAARGYYFELVGRPDGSFTARFRRPKTLNAGQLYRNAADAPLATCDAALSALAAPTEEGT